MKSYFDAVRFMRQRDDIRNAMNPSRRILQRGVASERRCQVLGRAYMGQDGHSIEKRRLRGLESVAGPLLVTCCNM